MAGCLARADQHAVPPMPALRQATPADMPGIWEVRYSVTENTLAPGRISDEELRAALQDTGRGWVVESDGRIDGFAIGHGQTGNIWALFVRPDAQGRGHGTRLHTAMLEWFRTQPVPLLWLCTGTHTRARRFCEQHGWLCVGPSGAEEVRYERPNPRTSL